MLTDWAERCPIFMIGFLVSGLGLNVILLNIGASLLGFGKGLQATPNLSYLTEGSEVKN